MGPRIDLKLPLRPRSPSASGTFLLRRGTQTLAAGNHFARACPVEYDWKNEIKQQASIDGLEAMLGAVDRLEGLERLTLQASRSWKVGQSKARNELDKKEIDKLLAAGPILVTMNTGAEHLITPADHPSCSDISLSYLAKDEEDGKWRHVHLPLVTMAQVVSEAPTQ